MPVARKKEGSASRRWRTLSSVRVRVLLRRAVTLDEVVGAGVVLEFGCAFDLSGDLLGQLLAKLHAPLIEAVDVPDDALREDGVLIERDEFTEHVGGEFAGEDGVGGAVAFEHAMRNEPVGGALGFDLLGGLAKGEGFGLSEDVGHEDVVMLAERVEGLEEADEVAGDEAGALVDELIEAVLAVGAGLAPVDGAGL